MSARVLLVRAVFACCVVAALLVAVPAVAQEMPAWAAPQQLPDDPPPQQRPAMPDGPTLYDPLPLDGGLALLALAGAGYAVRRLRRR